MHVTMWQHAKDRSHRSCYDEGSRTGPPLSNGPHIITSGGANRKRTRVATGSSPVSRRRRQGRAVG
eukprot:8915478-Pyramimonas_sp.AAC.1